MKRTIVFPALVLLVVILGGDAHSLPIGIALRGGYGIGYYSMDELGDHFAIVSRDYDIRMPELTSGVNVMLQGRLWLFDLLAASCGFEHFWGKSELESEVTGIVTYKTPANIYTIGGAVRVFEVPRVIDVNFGVNACFAKSTFGTNLLNPRRLSEYKGNKWGFELFAEAATNFLYPVEVGFQLGYRRLAVKSYEDKFGATGYFPGTNTLIQVDYSGFFFYLTAGIHL
jgi:hypothetical protein